MVNKQTEYSVQTLENLSSDQTVDPPILRRGILGKADDGSYYSLKVNDSGEAVGEMPAMKVTEVGSITYIAEAKPGSLQSASVWRCKKIDETSGVITTWADGDSNYDNVATDLTALTYT